MTQTAAWIWIALGAPVVAVVALELHFAEILPEDAPLAFFTAIALLIGSVFLWRVLTCKVLIKALAVVTYNFISMGVVTVATLVVAAYNGDAL